MIGDYATPKVRLPGAGGAPEIAASCREVFVLLRQTPRAFVERVDFVTSMGFGDGPGHRERLGLRGAGPQVVVTDIGILRPDPVTCELTLTALHPGVDRRAGPCRDRAGTSPSPAELETIAPPTSAELAALRRLQDA